MKNSERKLVFYRGPKSPPPTSVTGTQIYPAEDRVKTLVSDLDEELQPEGCYQELEWFLKCLAIFYFAVNKTRSDKLKWVTDKEAVFKVSIGADGTPFG